MDGTPDTTSQKMKGGSGSGSNGSGGGGLKLAAKAAGNKSVDGHMTACNDKSRQQIITHQPTIDGRIKIKGGRWWWQ